MVLDDTCEEEKSKSYWNIFSSICFPRRVSGIFRLLDDFVNSMNFAEHLKDMFVKATSVDDSKKSFTKGTLPSDVIVYILDSVEVVGKGMTIFELEELELQEKIQGFCTIAVIICCAQCSMLLIC